ncbi:Uncharacterised protein [Yersinia similis]|nr:Uncharacterised protein [Yersinia similis]
MKIFKLFFFQHTHFMPTYLVDIDRIFDTTLMLSILCHL